MPYNPQIHHRKSIRLKGYDYAQAGLYFITICVQNRECLFGEIRRNHHFYSGDHEDRPNEGSAEMILNDAGRMVENEWLKLPERFPNIHLHAYVVMPNHFHAILEIVHPTVAKTVGATLVVAPNNRNAADDGNAPNDADTPNDAVVPNDTIFGHNQGRPMDIGRPQGHAPTDAPNDTIAPNKTLGDMMAAFKSITTVEFIRGVKTLGWKPFNGKLWQRNYWEHIIRNDREYHVISEYIMNNPEKWDNDKLKI